MGENIWSKDYRPRLSPDWEAISREVVARHGDALRMLKLASDNKGMEAEIAHLVEVMLSAQPAERIATLERETTRLREALEEQWEVNHSEHCKNQRHHQPGETCHWPRPTALENRDGQD